MVQRVKPSRFKPQRECFNIKIKKWSPNKLIPSLSTSNKIKLILQTADEPKGLKNWTNTFYQSFKTNYKVNLE